MSPESDLRFRVKDMRKSKTQSVRSAPEKSRHALGNRLPSHEFYGQLGGIKVKIAAKSGKLQMQAVTTAFDTAGLRPVQPA